MRNETLRVDQIEVSNSAFDFSIDEPIARNSALDHGEGYSPQFARVIVREAPAGDPHELVYGHRILRELAPFDEVHAIILSGSASSDEACCQAILECDLTLQTGLLTHYERACVVRKWGVSDREAARKLGVSGQTVSNWIAGADQLDELLLANRELPEGPTFYHLVVLARETRDASSPVSIDDKVSYLKICAKNRQSVRKFEETLRKKLKPPQDVDGPPKNKPGTFPWDDDDDGGEDTGQLEESFGELESLIASEIRRADLQGIVSIEVTKTGQLGISATSIPVGDLGNLAACLSGIQSGYHGERNAA